MPTKEYSKIFDSCFTDVLLKLTPQEALAKLEAYEKAQEINVGDVVVYEDGSPMGVVVRKKSEENAHILFSDGSAGLHKLESFKKVGKHIDISSILEQIKEN